MQFVTFPDIPPVKISFLVPVSIITVPFVSPCVEFWITEHLDRLFANRSR